MVVFKNKVNQKPSELTVEQKIRVLRKWNRRISKIETDALYHHNLMSPEYGHKYLQEYFEDRRIEVVKKLGINHYEVKKYLREYERIELEHIPDELLYMGAVPQAHCDLIDFYHVTRLELVDE